MTLSSRPEWLACAHSDLQTSFSSFSILGEDVTASSDGSMALAVADASATGEK